WIVGIIDRGRHQGIGAFAHEAGIGTVKQDDGTAGVRPGKKCVDLFSAKRDHGLTLFVFVSSFRDRRLRVDPESRSNNLWIPGLRFARPGMTGYQVPAVKNDASRV